MDAEYANDYELLYRNHWWWQARSRFVRELIESLSLPTNARLLDIGCGGGWAFEDWERFGEVSGVELDETLVARSGKYRSQIYCGPFDRQYRPSKPFSLIVMLDVLEHLSEPEAALIYALELLEPGGKILVTVPSMPCVWTSHDDLNHHFVRYTKTSFQHLSNSSGFHIERMDYFFYWTTFVKLLFRCKETFIQSPPRSPTVPGPQMNALFRQLCFLEQRLFARHKLPFGTSLVCVGSKAVR